MCTQAEYVADLLAVHDKRIRQILHYANTGEGLAVEEIFSALNEVAGTVGNRFSRLYQGANTAIQLSTFQPILAAALQMLSQQGRPSCIIASGIQKKPRVLDLDEAQLREIEESRVEVPELWLYEPVARWLELVHAPATHLALITADGKKGTGANPDVLAVPAAVCTHLHFAHQSCDLIAVDAKKVISRNWPADLANASTYYRFANRVYMAYPFCGSAVGVARYFDSDFLRHAALVGVGVIAVMEPRRATNVRKWLERQMERFKELKAKYESLGGDPLFAKPNVYDMNRILQHPTAAEARDIAMATGARLMEFIAAAASDQRSAANFTEESLIILRLRLLRQMRAVLRDLITTTRMLNSSRRSWDSASVRVVLEAQPKPTSLSDAERVVQNSWRWVHKRKDVIAAVLRDVYGPFPALIASNIATACGILDGYECNGNGSTPVRREQLRLVVTRWKAELTRVLGRDALDVALAWIGICGTEYQCTPDQFAKAIST